MPDDKLTYKERNGSTRVGDSLRWLVKQGKNVAPGLLDIAGSITGIEGLKKLSDKIAGTEELTESEKIMLQAEIEMDKQDMLNVTKRWEADMTSDSWLSKNIRPLVLAFLMACMFIFVMLDSSIKTFIVAPEWVELLKNLLITVCLAYFGSRGVEKFKKISKNN
jgi:hypothetical protein